MSPKISSWNVRFALVGDLLADDPRHTGVKTALHLFRGKIAAVAIVPCG